MEEEERSSCLKEGSQCEDVCGSTPIPWHGMAPPPPIGSLFLAFCVGIFLCWGPLLRLGTEPRNRGLPVSTVPFDSVQSSKFLLKVQFRNQNGSARFRSV